jgi:hypothetical protein
LHELAYFLAGNLSGNESHPRQRGTNSILKERISGAHKSHTVHFCATLFVDHKHCNDTTFRALGAKYLGIAGRATGEQANRLLDVALLKRTWRLSARSAALRSRWVA